MTFFDLAPESVDLIGRMLMAALLGGIIGLERDIHGRQAGLRTHLLVCVGSALFMIISEALASLVPGYTNNVRPADPGRIAAQVVSGIGFLGAGAIIKEGMSIRGLTTASCLWMVAAIGLAEGAGMHTIAIAATIISLACLEGLHYFEKIYSKDSYRTLTVKTVNSTSVTDIIDTVRRKNLSVLHWDIECDYESNQMCVTLSLRVFGKGGVDKLSPAIVHDLENKKIPLKSIHWFHP